MNNDFFYREWNWIEQLSAAFHVFAANIKSILKVMLVVFLPISILESIINGRMLSAYTVFQQIAQAGVSLSNEADFFQAAYQVLFHSGLTLLVSLFLQPVGTIAIAKVVKQFVTKQEISFGTALGEAFSLMPTIVVSGIIYGVLIVLTSLIIVPGIYLSVAWVFYLYAIGLSDKKGMEPMRYSKSLVKGKWWRTLGYLLLLSVIAMLWNSAFQLIYSFFPNENIADAVYQFLCYFSAAFVTVGEVLLFLNRESITYGMPTEPAAEDTPAESVTGTVEGEPTEDRKDEE